MGRGLLALGIAGAVGWLIYGAFAAFHPSWLQVGLVAWLIGSGLLIAAAYRALRSPSAKRGQLAPALIGLVGVLIGAVVTSGIAYRGAELRRQAEARVARRLVASEIRTDIFLLYGAYQYGRLVEPPHFRDWQTQRAVLARLSQQAVLAEGERVLRRYSKLWQSS
jgi:hypothetical protein